jgi:hypothetical protein
MFQSTDYSFHYTIGRLPAVWLVVWRMTAFGAGLNTALWMVM